MPRVAVDFSKTVIYHFVCKNEMIKCSYVGSTTNFVKRKANHKSSCHNETAKNYHLKIYQTIREHGGWNNWNMKPLEEFPCENNTQQVIREQYWIDQLKPELNCQVAHREGENHLEKQKAYYHENKGLISEKYKEYYQSNKEAISEQKKAHYKANTEVLAEKQKAYRKANLVVIAEKQKVWYEAKKLKKQRETEQ